MECILYEELVLEVDVEESEVTEATVKEIDIQLPSSFPIKENSYHIEWFKKEGDRIAPGDKLCELHTPKNDIDFEFEGEGVVVTTWLDESRLTFELSISPTMIEAEGTIVKLCQEDGDEIELGDVLCKIQTAVKN